MGYICSRKKFYFFKKRYFILTNLFSNILTVGLSRLQTASTTSGGAQTGSWLRRPQRQCHSSSSQKAHVSPRVVSLEKNPRRQVILIRGARYIFFEIKKLRGFFLKVNKIDTHFSKVIEKLGVKKCSLPSFFFRPAFFCALQLRYQISFIYQMNNNWRASLI